MARQKQRVFGRTLAEELSQEEIAEIAGAGLDPSWLTAPGENEDSSSGYAGDSLFYTD